MLRHNYYLPGDRGKTCGNVTRSDTYLQNCKQILLNNIMQLKIKDVLHLYR